VTALATHRSRHFPLVERIAWLPVGVLAAGAVSVIGMVTLPLGLVVAGLLTWRLGPRGAVFGVPAGIGLGLFAIACIQWQPGGFDGPHWAIAGVVAFAAGAGLDLLARRIA
jgi:hypothetical protein